MRNMGKLTVSTPNELELTMTRVFNAPRRMVFDAHTKPELLKRWLGVHRGWWMAVCDIDLRVGGAYRYVWRGPDRKDMGVSGVFREIVSPERLVNTERFDDAWYTGEALNTLLLIEEGGKTTLTSTLRFESKEARDEVLRSPMDGGVATGYDTLEQLLSSELKTPHDKELTMIDTPRILQTEAQLTALIHVTVPRAGIQQVMGPGISELMATVAGQGIKPAGPWFTHHLRITPDEFDFEIGIPVTTPVKAAGRVKPGHWPAMKVVRTVYQGPYEGMGPAWGEFEGWMKQQGLQPAQDLWEVYVAGPESGPDPKTWRTELNRPLVD
ncbi:SRPBCC domain-containing protein [Corallococcus carmarthensis]|nr:SRPBCC domain-containing protein [Corallococcus carmarthensis]